MIRIVARRILTGVVTLLFVTWIIFALIQAAPGDPLHGEASGESAAQGLNAAQIAELRAQYHWDEPLPRRYARWLADVLRGDLGKSFRDQRAVSEKILERVGTTFSLNIVAFGIMLALAVPIGCAAAARPGSRWDRWSGIVAYALYSVPVFWAALVLQLVFAVRLEWLPLYGLHSDAARAAGALARACDRAAHLVLPVACLSYGGIAYIARFVRANLLESAFGDAARAARARGVAPARLLLVHGFRSAAVPLLTLAGFLLPALLGGSVIVETVFGVPGAGLLFTDSVKERDLPVILGLALMSGTATLMGIIGADIAYAAVDPRTGGDGRR